MLASILAQAAFVPAQQQANPIVIEIEEGQYGYASSKAESAACIKPAALRDFANNQNRQQ